MARVNAPYTNFNGGEIGDEVQARINLEGYGATASILENWLPEVEGPMGLRPGFGFKVQPIESSPFIFLHPFRYSVSQKALFLLSNNALRIAQDGGVIANAAVSSTIPNGSFATPSTNLAINTPTAGQAPAAGALANLVDGSGATGITSGNNATQNFIFDLGSAQSVSRLTLFAPTSNLGNAPGNFTLEYSATGSFSGEQVTALTVAGAPAWTALERRTHSFTAASARYWRLQITTQQDGGSAFYVFNEVWLHNGSWWDVSSGALSSAVLTGGQMRLTAALGGRAAMTVLATTASAGQPHALQIDVARGPVRVRVGSTLGSFELLNAMVGTGLHSIVFTPPGANYYVEVSTTERVQRIVESVQIASAGDLVLTTPWGESLLPSLRFAQRNDVVYVASGVGRLKKIERRGPSSWSIVDTDERDGPFLGTNLDTSIRLTPSATSGNITLSSTVALFEAGHVGALFQLTHSGQIVQGAISAVDEATDSIFVQGVKNDRRFLVTISGTWSGTLVLQRSVGNDTSFADTSTTYTTNQTNDLIDDGLDNQQIYYRIRASAWTSGTATITITYSGGTTVGVVRITAFGSNVSVSAEVLKQLGSTNSTALWQEGAWSDAAYWPKAIGFSDGRLWSLAEDRFWASVSDSYESYEQSEEVDDAISGPLATGDASPGMWVLGLSRLLFGTEGAEITARESTQDGAITSANITLREYGTNGSADIAAIKVDTQGVSIDRSAWRAILHSWSVDAQNYTTSSLMRLHRNLGKPGIRQVAVSRQPETRLWMVRTDGVLLTKSFNTSEAVLGWSRVITDGEIESVAVLPCPSGRGEDEVWVMVARTVGDVTVRYLELMAQYYYESAAEANRLDSSVYYDGAPTNTFTALHLRGRTVRVWGDGARLQDRVANAVTGQFTIEKNVSKCVYGLGVTARYRSSRLAIGAQGGTALGQRGRSLSIVIGIINSVGNLLYGDTFEKMDSIRDRMTDSTYDSGPGLRTGETDHLTVPVARGTDRNPMLCLKAEGPGPIRVSYYALAHLLKERVT